MEDYKSGHISLPVNCKEREMIELGLSHSIDRPALQTFQASFFRDRGGGGGNISFLIFCEISSSTKTSVGIGRSHSSFAKGLPEPSRAHLLAQRHTI